MAAVTLGFLLNQLTDFARHEYNLLNGVEADITSIEDELTMWSAILTVAEKQHNNNDLIKACIMNMRAVNFEMQDVLDKIKLQFAQNNVHVQEGACLTSIDKTCHLIQSLQSHRQIAKRLRGIKSRADNISKTYEELRSVNLDIGGRGVDNGNDRPIVHLNEGNLVGIAGAKNQLIEWLFERSDLEVHSVIGIGGVGKTTLVKQVYDDVEVKKRFKLRAWITLSRRFEAVDLLRDMLQQLLHVIRRPNPPGLIVLDDVWEPEARDTFQMALPNNNNGSRVLLTTEILPVANYFCAESRDRIYMMKSLSRQESWTLFCSRTFQRDRCPGNLLSISERFLNRCEGLPLAIVAISGVLARIDRGNLDEWEMVYRTLGVDSQDQDILGRMRTILLFSYFSLPPDIKSCLLYLSIFPEGYPIDKMRLIRLWVAEGFVTTIEGMTREEVAEGYLNRLIERSLIQVVEKTSDDRVKQCRMHGLLHKIIISKAKDLCFAVVITEGSTSPKMVRRISVHNATGAEQIAYFKSRLCSLLVFPGQEPSPEYKLSSLTSIHLKMLFVLDLGGTPLNEFPDEITNLLLLKYLSLRNTKVKFIPDSIYKLQYLETLDLKNSRVTELPTTIVGLQKLRHLLVYQRVTEVHDHLQTKYTIGFKLECNIVGLQSLQKLCFIEPNENNRLLSGLRKLKKLRRLGIVCLRAEYGEILGSSIQKLTNLRALSLSSIGEDEVIDLTHMRSAPPLLQRLYLTGILRTLPIWISSLNNLKKLVLKGSRLTENPLPHLQHLPSLLHLEFLEAYDGERLEFERGFEMLKFLGINKLDRLNEISVQQGSLPRLQKLIVQRCQLLKKVPSGLQHLRRLKVVEFINMPLEMIMNVDPDRDEHRGSARVVQVLEVNFYTYWNSGSWDVFSRQLSLFTRDESRPVLVPIVVMMSAIAILVAIVYQWEWIQSNLNPYLYE